MAIDKNKKTVIGLSINIKVLIFIIKIEIIVISKKQNFNDNKKEENYTEKIEIKEIIYNDKK